MAQTPRVTKTMWAGRLSLVPMGLFIATVFIFMWIATQRVALALAYQPELGTPWFSPFGLRVYKPWDVIGWNYWYHYYAPEIFTRSMGLIAIGAVVGLICALIYVIWSARRARVATSAGTAVWGTTSDAAGAKVLEGDGEGVVLGVWDDGRYLQDNTERHALITAPTGSGKGVGVIIPTLLNWRHSVVIHDIKGENWDVTAGYRAKFSNVLYFNPCKLESCHFNPLYEIRPGVNQVKDAQNIVSMLIDPLGKKDLQFWDREATTFMVACLLHVLYCEPNKSLAGVAYFLSDPSRAAVDTINMMRTRNYGDADTTRFINSSAQQAHQKYEKELSGVISTCLSVLGLYRDPLIEKITADSDFRITDLFEGEKPVSLYLVIPPSDDLRIMPLVRLMWAQIGRRLMEDHQGASKRQRMLLVMDEFPTLGYMEIFHTGIAKMRSYGVKILIVTQSTAQIDDIYGPNHSFFANCDIRTFNTPNDNKTAEAISVALGPTTEVHQQKTFTGHRLSPWLGHVMVADQESARPLLTPGEVLTFPDTETLIFIRSVKPLRAKKLRYYQDRSLMKRVLTSPPLRVERPYLYRTKPHPNPWLMIEKRARTANAHVVAQAAAVPADGAVKKKTADEEPGAEIERYDEKVRAKVRERERQMDLNLAPDSVERPGDSDFDSAHEALVASANSKDVEAVVDTSLTRRAEFDRQQGARAAEHKQHARVEREAELGR